MADLSQMLSQILSTDEGKNQVNQVLSMLGQGGQQNDPPAPSGGGSGGNSGGMPDLSGLLASLGAGAQQNQNSAPSNSGGMPDLSGLFSMLGQNGGSNGASQGGGGAGGGLPNLDIGKLMKVQQLLSQRRDDSSTALLRALKPHLAEENRKKVDEAVRIMELLDLLPLIKESGLLGSLLGGDGE